MASARWWGGREKCGFESAAVKAVRKDAARASKSGSSGSRGRGEGHGRMKLQEEVGTRGFIPSLLIPACVRM